MPSENFRMVPPPPQRANEHFEYSTEEKEFVPAEEISPRQYSREEMLSERSALATEIMNERSEGREQIRELNEKISELTEILEREQANIEAMEVDISEVSALRAARASTLAGKFKHLLKIETSEDEHIDMVIEAMRDNVDFSKTKQAEITTTLTDSTNELIDVDARLKALKDKIATYYEGASESILQTVEQSMVRNGAFFIHVINEHPDLRHNAFSNVSKDTTFDDDLDIFLSLEPSVSASSVIPGVDEEGKVSGLWSGGQGGLLIGRGKVTFASEHDMDTKAAGIKDRYSSSFGKKVTSHEQIDKAVGYKRAIDPNSINKPIRYNEFVIDNPEAIGYVGKCFVDENGWFWTSEADRKHYIESKTGMFILAEQSERMLKNNVNNVLNRLQIVRERGLPFYVMTPDRKFFEVIRIQENGQILVGEELTPEKAAHANAGLPPEQRKELGQRVLQKQVFLHEQTMQEARGIIEDL